MGATGGARPRLFLAVFLAIVVGAFSAARDASAGVQPRLTYAETLNQDVRFQRYDDGQRYADLVTTGTYRVQVRLPLTDVDLESIDESTYVYFRFGNLVLHQFLGDDFDYSYGQRKARFVRAEWVGNGKYEVPVLIELVWNRRNVLLTLTGRTPELQDPLLAQQYLGQISKAITTSSVAEFQFGEVYADFAVSVKGRVTSRTREFQQEPFIVSKVRLQGTGI